MSDESTMDWRRLTGLTGTKTAQPASGPDMAVTVDKTDTVVAATRTDNGSRWRFKRQRRFVAGGRRKLTEEQEQEICALYVDHPGMTLDKIERRFGLSGGTINRVIEAYGLPLRRPYLSRAMKKARAKPLGTVTTETARVVPTARPVEVEPHVQSATAVWLVTVVREVTEQVTGDLLDVAARFDGQRIIRVERKDN